MTLSEWREIARIRAERETPVGWLDFSRETTPERVLAALDLIETLAGEANRAKVALLMRPDNSAELHGASVGLSTALAAYDRFVKGESDGH